MKPFIGVVMRCEENENQTSIQYAMEFVRTTIIKANGEPVFLTPPQNLDYFKTKYRDYTPLTDEEKETIHFWLDNIQGLFIPGGTKFTEYDRYILEQAIKRKIPVLGVCLGMQLMSCYKQEVLLNDISSPIQHDAVLEEYAHAVTIDKNSRLYDLLGKDEMMVNSFHKKQVVENPAYQVVARSSDGVIEALEYPGEVFHVGVQWHPEKMYDYDRDARKIIDAFILESSRRETKLSLMRENYASLSQSEVVF